jgi:hypothetical protein
MKIRVAGMAWLPKEELEPRGIAYFKQELRIVPRKSVAYDNTPPTPIDCWVETPTEFGIPRDFFFATAQREHEIQWDMCFGEKIEYESRIRHEGVYVEQAQAIEEILGWFEGLQMRGMKAGPHLGAILKADPAFGKTNTALSMLYRIGRTAVVIVHKERLLVQWQRRIERFLPGARVGIVQENKCQFEDRDIVIAMAQSLALEGKDGKQRYPQEFYNWPGVLVVDESLGRSARILTRQGWRQIGGLVESDEEVEVLAFNEERAAFEWKKVTRKWKHAPRSSMLRITHARGVLECTANHEVLTVCGYKRAGELVPGTDCVVCCEDVEARGLAERTGGTDCRLDDGRRLFVSNEAGRQGEVQGQPLNEASPISGCEVRSCAIACRDSAEDSGEQGVGEEIAGFFNPLIAESFRASSQILSRERKVSRRGMVGRELVGCGDGMVGYGRRFGRCEESCIDVAHRGVSSREGGRASKVDVRRVGSKCGGDASKKWEIQNSSVQCRGILEGGGSSHGVSDSIDAVQDSSNFGRPSESSMCGVRTGYSIGDGWKIQKQTLLRQVEMSKGSKGDEFGAFPRCAKGDRQEVCDSSMRGLRKTDRYQHSPLYEEEGVFQLVPSSESDSRGSNTVLRKAQRNDEWHHAASRVLCIEEIETPEEVYDLTVEDYHNFVVDGVVAHNCHRISAPTWSPIPMMFPAQFRLGLSATPRRKDGADDVFWWHIGQIRYSAKTEMPKPAVRVVESGARGPDILRLQSTPIPIVINILTKLTWRNKVIIGEIMKALKSPHQRKLMVLSERLEHLRELDEMLAEACEGIGLEGITTGFYVGEWFTGEQAPRLVKGHWEMDEEGREKAIETVFQSFKRRKALAGEKSEGGHRCILLGEEWLDLDGLHEWNPKPPEGMSQGQWDEKKVNIMAAADTFLFKVAKEYKIAQKKSEKKKPRTEAELTEAERARVMWVTYQMCGEGINQPAVDTIGFATPISDVEQAYGRGRRICVPVAEGGETTPEMCEHYCPWKAGECKSKPPPMAFDIVDRNVRLARKRQGYRKDFYDSVEARVAGATS